METVVASFGELLKVFRKRQGLTQQQLALQLGVHRNTIGSWERCDFLPESCGIVLELSRLLCLQEQEARQLLEAGLTALAPRWSIPYLRNPFFTGREEVIDELHARLSPNQTVVLTQSHAIYGLGGIGKTQIAVEYAYRHALEYSAVFWIGAENTETLIAGFLNIAERLRLPEREEVGQRQIVAAVQRWLVTHKGWLLIWDNVEDLELISPFLPSTRQGAMLFTTRVQALGTLAHGIELSTMGQEEGMMFLLLRTKLLDPQATSEQLDQFAKRNHGEYTAARKLVTIMGGLPLALDQAGAYIAGTGCRLSDYLGLYEQRGAQLLSIATADHLHSVTTTFRLICQHVASEHPGATEMLNLCAFLHAEAIPEEIFGADLVDTTPVEAEGGVVIANPFQIDPAIATLCSFSLVQRYPKTRTLSIHRLVQDILREEMSEPERTRWQQQAIQRLNALFTEVTLQAWQQNKRILSHALTCTASIPDQARNQVLVNVLHKAADYLRQQIQYKQAEPLYQRALRLQQQLVGPDHPDMAPLLRGLAVLYAEQGQYKRAEPLFERALYLWEQAVGPDHPDLLPALRGLAIVYRSLGRYSQAASLHQRVMHIHEQALKPESPLLAQALHGLANVYVDQGEYEQAEPLFERSLRILEQALGLEHFHLIYPLHGLGDLYRKWGRYEYYEQAEAFYQRAVRIVEQEFGPEHFYVTNTFLGLGDLYRNWGRYEQAEAYYQRILHTWERDLPAESLAALFNGMADLSRIRKNYEQAESLSRRALGIWEQQFGPEHHHVAYALYELATLYYEQDRYEEAKPLYQRALSIQERHLGEWHLETARSLAGLARLYEKQGSNEQAKALLQRACPTFERRLGQDHPDTIKVRSEQRCLLERGAG